MQKGTHTVSGVPSWEVPQDTLAPTSATYIILIIFSAAPLLTEPTLTVQDEEEVPTGVSSSLDSHREHILAHLAPCTAGGSRQTITVCFGLA